MEEKLHEVGHGIVETPLLLFESIRWMCSSILLGVFFKHMSDRKKTKKEKVLLYKTNT